MGNRGSKSYFRFKYVKEQRVDGSSINCFLTSSYLSLIRRFGFVWLACKQVNIKIF